MIGHTQKIEKLRIDKGITEVHLLKLYNEKAKKKKMKEIDDQTLRRIRQNKQSPKFDQSCIFAELLTDGDINKLKASK